MQRHRHQEFIRFLNVIDARFAEEKAVHVIIDNYAAHKHPKVLEWIDNQPSAFVFHFTPTSASWLNAVEGFFAKLTKKRLKRGVFRSLQELKDAIHRFLDDHQRKPKPFTWTNDPDKIIAAVKRGHQVLDSIHSLMIACKGFGHGPHPADFAGRQRNLYGDTRGRKRDANVGQQSLIRGS